MGTTGTLDLVEFLARFDRIAGLASLVTYRAYDAPPADCRADLPPVHVIPGGTAWPDVSVYLCVRGGLWFRPHGTPVFGYASLDRVIAAGL